MSLYSFMRTYRDKTDTTAVIYGSHKIGFGAFFREIDRVAAGLYKLGVRRGDTVILALPNIPQSVMATYALSRLGAIASMVHPKLSADEFAAVVESQKPKAVFLSDVNLRVFYKRKGNAKCVLCHFGLYDYLGLPHAKYFEEYEGDGEDTMFYMQSGGTSGYPKTIALSSRAVNAMAGNLLHFLDDKFNENDAMFAGLPMFHGFGLCVGMHASLCTNMPIVLVPVFNAKKVVKIIEKQRITTMVAVPRMISKLLLQDGFANEKVRSIKNVFVGGDFVGEDLIRAFDERMKESGGEGKLYPGYGLSETCGVCVVSKERRAENSVGKPIDGLKIKIVDECMRECAFGETGELLVCGEQVMSGYLDDESATNDAFCIIDGEKWLKTGDLFRADEDGNLFFMGRKKRLIKISGINVFPTEIERVAKELPYVNECVCIEYYEHKKPYIKLVVEGELTTDEKKKIIAHIAKRMSHWNVPREVECQAVFPRTKIGKINLLEMTNEHSKNR